MYRIYCFFNLEENILFDVATVMCPSRVSIKSDKECLKSMNKEHVYNLLIFRILATEKKHDELSIYRNKFGYNYENEDRITYEKMLNDIRGSNIKELLVHLNYLEQFLELLKGIEYEPNSNLGITINEKITTLEKILETNKKFKETILNNQDSTNVHNLFLNLMKDIEKCRTNYDLLNIFTSLSMSSTIFNINSILRLIKNTDIRTKLNNEITALQNKYKETIFMKIRELHDYAQNLIRIKSCPEDAASNSKSIKN
jgi:hypothetical protein